MWKSGLPILCTAALLFSGCTRSMDSAMVNDLLQRARAALAPDKRTAVFDVTAGLEGDALVLRGEIQSPALKHQLMRYLRDSLSMRIVDSLTALPDSSLGNRVFGLVSVSVANLRAKPGHEAELVSQATLGTPVRILKQRKSWLLVQTPDQYLGWTIDLIVRMDSAEMSRWAEMPKILVTEAFGFTRESPDPSSPVVSDYVAGSLLGLEKTTGSTYEVHYPDGRHAYLDRRAGQPYAEWLQSVRATPEAVVATARRFTGIPYLWGGTSSKAMDCSGFTKTVFALNGVLLPRDASQQWLVGEEVDSSLNLDALQTGDLLFFGSHAKADRPMKVTHVGIYIGGGRFIHSPGAASATGIGTNSFNASDPDYNDRRRSGYLGARRIIGSGPARGVDSFSSLPYYSGHGY